jgi:opacity protein-like surface antigen
MTRPVLSLCLTGLGVGVLASPLAAQGYRLRLDARAQAAAYRGIRADSVLFTDVVIAPTGGFQTTDGFFVRCPPGATHCFFFRPGPYRQGGPLVTSADLTLWGLGLTGLSVRINARAGTELGESDAWPGTEPPVQLLEAYAEYGKRWWTGRIGRQILTNRLGIAGIDGARALVRHSGTGLEAEAYLGWGLARATAVAISNSALDPLDDFQPSSRQLVAGGALGWAGRSANVRLDYQREVDRDVQQLASERIALSGEARLLERWSVAAGAEYDLANTWFGTAEATVRYAAPRVTAMVGARQYRPHFDLWTIWGAFSPVPYHAVNAAVWLRPNASLELRGRWEQYAFSPTETSTPLVDVDDDGWRLGVGASFSLNSRWTFDAGYSEEYGPGASSHGFEGSVSALPTTDLTLTAYGSTLDRPLEFRFEEAGVDVIGLDAEWRPSPSLRLSLGLANYSEDRRRPDASSFDWNQTRVRAGVTLVLGSGADRLRLPKALRTRPRAGSR